MAEAALEVIRSVHPAKASKKPAFLQKSLELTKKLLPNGLVLKGDRLLLHMHSARFFRMKKEQEMREAETGRKLEESEAQKKTRQRIDELSGEFCSLTLLSYGPDRTIGTCDFFEKDCFGMRFSFGKAADQAGTERRIAVTEELMRDASGRAAAIAREYEPKASVAKGAAAIAAGVAVAAIGLAAKSLVADIAGLFVILAGAYAAGSELTEFAYQVLWGMVDTVRDWTNRAK